MGWSRAKLPACRRWVRPVAIGCALAHHRQSEEIDLERGEDPAGLRVPAGDAGEIAAHRELEAKGRAADEGRRDRPATVFARAEASPGRAGVDREAPLST